jgi:RpiB/LacA/LacB family sugar-phosphate isomerase
MRIAIAADHAGVDLKDKIGHWLQEMGHEPVDLGTHGHAPVDYPDFAEAVGLAVRKKDVDRGIVVCGSGVGACVAANKIPGIRAGVCHDTYSGHQGVEHDDMNVLVLGGRIIGAELAKEVVHAFVSAEFSGQERHKRRLEKIAALEDSFFARKNG